MQQYRESNPHFVTPPLSPPLSPPHPQPTSRDRRPKKVTPRPVTKQQPPPPNPPLPPANFPPQPHHYPPIPYVPPRESHHYQQPPEALLHPGSWHPSEDGQHQLLPAGNWPQQLAQQHLVKHHSDQDFHQGDHVLQPQQSQLHPSGNRPQKLPPQQQPGKHHRDQDSRHGNRQQQPHRHPAGNRPPQLQQQPGRHHASQDGHSRHQRSSVRVTGSRRKTRPVAWLIAAFCTIFWIIIIVGGLTVLIVYLVFHPKLPKFDISSVTLNAAYLDMGYLLNADVTILGNFTNPNKKVNIDFNSVVMQLYHERAFIATRYVEPFTAVKRQTKLQDIHMITSQVPLTLRHSQELQRQMDNGRVKFEIKGQLRARSKLGGVLRYSYWLYSHCTITVTGPPAGVMIAHKCITKH